MSWDTIWDAALWWLPTAAVAAMTVFGSIAIAAQPQDPNARQARKYWVVALVVVGALATAASGRQQQANRAALGDETARLQELASHLDELGGLLRAPPGTSPEATFDTVSAAIVALNARIGELEAQALALREKARTRVIEPETAAKLADYLRRSGSHRVVVSCLPEDLEAFNYANQLANVLRAAGWDALGPEKTTIFGEASAMGVRLYVRGGATPETGKILIDAFTRFNVPYQSGITPSDAIPDPATVELFVAPKP
jgi:hypothetical protein